jgi:hypothetical protein
MSSQILLKATPSTLLVIIIYGDQRRHYPLALALQRYDEQGCSESYEPSRIAS